MTDAAAIAEANLVRAKRREIAIRYGRGRKLSIAAFRCAQLNRLYKDRCGDVLPDDDAGTDYAFIMANHLALLSEDQMIRIKSWLAKWAPWMAAEAVERLLDQALSKPVRWGADKLAARLNLAEAERRRLGITTIGCIDMSKDERASARIARKRQAERKRRRSQGAKLRAEYLAEAATRAKPWEADGCSRRTWYRRRAKEARRDA